jgi:uncharacterized protein YtpQ (UPF0354 family)
MLNWTLGGKMFSFFKKKEKALRIVPRIKNTNFLSALSEIPGMTENLIPITMPIVGDLLLTYSIDQGTEYTSISKKILSDIGKSMEDVHSTALSNCLQVMRSLRMNTNDLFYELSADENMAACSILFPELWKQIEEEIGGKAIVAFPHRDAVLYTRQDSDAGVTELNRLLNTLDFSDNHSLSKKLYKIGVSGWEISS